MKKEVLDYSRLVLFPGHQDNIDGFDIILDSGMFLSKKVHESLKPEDRNEIVNDALILFQMVLTKGIAIRSLSTGVKYVNPIEQFQLNPLHDPMSTANLVRTQFEAYSNFHNIFVAPESDDIRQFLYDSWVISGLKTRQNYSNDNMSEEHKTKASEEKETLERFMSRFKSNTFYLTLDEKKRAWVDQRIKKRVFEFLIKEGNITTPGWRDLFLNSGVKDIFYHQYSFLSLCTHPSNVSVFQFDQMFKDGSNIDMTISIMNRSKEIMAFLIHDYCEFMPNGKKLFDKLPKINKVLIDSINTSFRNENCTIFTEREQFYTDLENQMMQIHNSKNGK